MAKVGDLVEVTWLDAWADSEQTSVDQFKDRCEVKTVGMIVRLTDTHISIAGEWFPDYAEKDFRNITHIPLRMLERQPRKLR